MNQSNRNTPHELEDGEEEEEEGFIKEDFAADLPTPPLRSILPVPMNTTLVLEGGEMERRIQDIHRAMRRLFPHDTSQEGISLVDPAGYGSMISTLKCKSLFSPGKWTLDDSSPPPSLSPV